MLNDIKNKFELENLGILSILKLTYRIIFSNIIIFLILPIMSLVVKFLPIKFLLIIDPIMYLLIIIILEYLFYNKLKYKLSRLIIFVAIIVLLEFIVFPYIFLIFPYLILLRNIDYNTSLYLSFNLTVTNFKKVFLSTFIQTIIWIFILSLTAYILMIFYGIIPTNTDQIMQLVLPYSGYIKAITTYIFAIQFYVIYKNIEYNDIINKG